MAEIYDDRRQETRFAAQGEGEVDIQGKSVRGTLIDLSINGLRMGRPPGFSPPDGSRFALNLLIPGADPFRAEVALIRLDDAAFSVEFMDMSPKDFGLLTTLIDRFAHLSAQTRMQQPE
ncbi:MAG: PilZ domain-containing protein [Rhodanobacteraceae bacterium]|nr:PilZ domain-containing protein [Rhodanobacteraceae bacterium]MBP9153545.1 PilZ domain-containing protein [Xanthomonadales bacterium]